MAEFIVRLADPVDQTAYYFLWSTIVDAPITRGMDREKMRDLCKKKYSLKARDVEFILDRAHDRGVSSSAYELYEILRWNRAGENEESLDLNGLLDKFCRECHTKPNPSE